MNKTIFKSIDEVFIEIQKNINNNSIEKVMVIFDNGKGKIFFASGEDFLETKTLLSENGFSHKISDFTFEKILDWLEFQGYNVSTIKGCKN